MELFLIVTTMYFVGAVMTAAVIVLCFGTDLNYGNCAKVVCLWPVAGFLLGVIVASGVVYMTLKISALLIVGLVKWVFK